MKNRVLDHYIDSAKNEHIDFDSIKQKRDLLIEARKTRVSSPITLLPIVLLVTIAVVCVLIGVKFR